MTRIQSFKGVSRGDFPHLTPEDTRVFEAVSKPLQESIELLQGRLGIDNENREIRDISLFHNTETTIEIQKVKGGCIGVVPLWNEIFDYVQVVPRFDSEREVTVKVWFSTAPSEKVLTRLWFLGR